MGTIIRQLSPEQLRDYIIRVHEMATERYVQSDATMRRRIGALLARAIREDDVMRGFLGYGGPRVDCDLLTGNGSLEIKPKTNMESEKERDENRAGE